MTGGRGEDNTTSVSQVPTTYWYGYHVMILHSNPPRGLYYPHFIDGDLET